MNKKFRIWDSKLLLEAYQEALQIKSLIETTSESARNQNTTIPEESVVPTEMLYNIMTAYEGLYDAMLKFDLAEFSTQKLTQKTIH